MKDTLKPGLSFEMQFRVPESKTVPHLYPESPEFQVMPEVFATGYLVGLLEWACLKALIPHIDWPKEQSVGTHVNVRHTAATPVGLTVAVKGRITRVDGRRVSFEVVAHDGEEEISRGTHERFVIDAQRFKEKMAAKRERG